MDTQKKKMGRPPKKRNEDIVKAIITMSAFGIPQEDIAASVNLSVETLQKLYSYELQLGRRSADIKIRQTLYKQAIEEKNTACLIFLCKTRLRMKENYEIDHTSSDGSMSPVPAINIDFDKFSPEELSQLTLSAFRGQPL